MTQLIEGSTAPTFAEEPRLIDPADIGHRRLQDIDSEISFLSSLIRVMFLTSASDLSIGDRLSSSATGGWKVLKIPLAHDRISSLVDDAKLQPSIWYEPYGTRGANQVAREWAVALASAANHPAITTRAVPIILEEEQAIPEMSAHTWNSDLRVLLLEEQLVSYFTNLVREAADEAFLDGMESVFSHRLTRAVEDYGDTAVLAIGRLLDLDQANVEVAGEILRQVGSMADSRTHHSRLATLVDKLQSPDPRIRDAASLGLAALDDPETIADVQKALDRESSPQLRSNLKLVVDQLRTTKWQLS